MSQNPKYLPRYCRYLDVFIIGRLIAPSWFIGNIGAKWGKWRSGRSGAAEDRSGLLLGLTSQSDRLFPSKNGMCLFFFRPSDSIYHLYTHPRLIPRMWIPLQPPYPGARSCFQIRYGVTSLETTYRVQVAPLLHHSFTAWLIDRRALMLTPLADETAQGLPHV